MASATKPVAIAFLGDEQPMPEEFLLEIRAAGIPFFRSPERAMRAFANIASSGNPVPLPQAVAPLAGEPRIIAEHEGKAVLARAGFAVPAGELATTPDAACAIAARIGYPVALKVQSAAIAHKSDLGGVKLKLADEAALRTAWRDIDAAFAGHEAGPIDGMLVETMAEPFPLELVVSARRDPAWGAVVIAGLGGVWTELMRDIRMMPAGLPGEEIERRLLSLKGAALMQGYRGGPALDVDAVVSLIEALGHLVLSDPAMAEIEINPVAVYPRGQGVRILDVLMSRRV